MGIIGKTHGVNNERNPIERARRINGKNPSIIAASKLIFPELSRTESVFNTISKYPSLGGPSSIFTLKSKDSLFGG